MQLNVIYYYTKTCSICKTTKQRLKELFSDYPSIDFIWDEINIETDKERAGQDLVFEVPTVSIKTDNQELLKQSRIIDIRNIKRMLDTVSS